VVLVDEVGETFGNMVEELFPGALHHLYGLGELA
jgi:hypothetical protein